MNSMKTIECLNALIVLNNDRIEGYETAQKETDDLALNKAFSDFQSTSFKCKSELVAEVRNLHGKPQQGIREPGKFFENWLEVKNALVQNNIDFVLESCLSSEIYVLEFYKNDLIQNNEIHTSLIAELLNKQYSLLKNDYDIIQQLKHDLITVKH